MTVVAQIPEVSHTGDGATKIFAIPFRLDEASWLRVTLDGLAVVQAVDYVVEGAMARFYVAPPAGVSIGLARRSPDVQARAFPNVNSIKPQSLETAHDLHVLGLQESRAILDRALVVPIGENPPAIPSLAARQAGGFLATQALTGALILAVGMTGVPATTYGASLIGNTTADAARATLEIPFVRGPTVPVAGSKMAIEWDWSRGSYALEDLAGIWGDKVYTAVGVTKEFTAANTGGSVNAPSNAFFTYAINNGAPSDVVALMAVSRLATSTGGVFAGNLIAMVDAGVLGGKAVGLEIDVEYSIGSTSAGTGGALFANVFTATNVGPVLQSGTIDGGTFSNGIILHGLSASAAGLFVTGTANSLIDSTVGTFTTAALHLGNGVTRGIMLRGTASVHARIYNDTADNVRMVMGAGAWTIRNSADVASLVVVDNGGNLDLQAGGVLRIAGIQVARARQAGWTAGIGTANLGAFNAATATATDCAQRILALEQAMRTSGTIN